SLALAASVYEPKTGRVMEISTTEPGIQFYSGNFLDGSIKGKDAVYNKHSAFCLETQHFPDAPNKPDFPSIVLRPGEEYTHLTVHKFSAR
ncbi:MAG: aldose epimerase family protein, partial [Planctomycetota bacterium]